MPNAIVLTRIGTLYLAALLNALGAGALAASSGAIQHLRPSIKLSLAQLAGLGLGRCLAWPQSFSIMSSGYIGVKGEMVIRCKPQFPLLR